MTTGELVAEINGLTLVERERVSVFIEKIKKGRRCHPDMRTYTKAEFLAALEESRAQSEKGQTEDAYLSLAKIRGMYGLSA